MIKSDENFVDNNVGLGLKIKEYQESDNYFYGRLYNVGYGSKSTSSMMFNDIISMVTPNGNVISGRAINFEVLNENDKEILNGMELLCEKPYYPHLIKNEDKYYRAYEFNKKTLKCNIKEEKGEKICYINKQIFGNALSYICSIHLEKEYYFNNYKFIYKGKKNKETPDYDELQERYISVISSRLYPSVVEQYFGDELYSPYSFINGNSRSIDNVKYETMFFQKPLQISENELLLFFCSSDNEKLKIGEIINNKFIPNIRIFEKSHDINFSKEVNFNNDNFNFIHDFIIEIIKYKLQNEKMEITEEDMKIIIQEYEKQNIKQKVKKINM